jgi:hypothetical protein
MGRLPHGLLSGIGLAAVALGLRQLLDGLMHRGARSGKRPWQCLGAVLRCITCNQAALGGPAIGAEGCCEVLGLLGTALDECGGLALGLAGGRCVALRETVGSLLHGARSLLAQGLGSLLGGSAGALAERPCPVVQVGQAATQRNGLVAQGVLWCDLVSQDGLQTLAHLPLAPGDPSGFGPG